MIKRCPSCGVRDILYVRKGKFFCSSCMVNWIFTNKEPPVDAKLPDDVAAQNIAEGCKYEC